MLIEIYSAYENPMPDGVRAGKTEQEKKKALFSCLVLALF